MSRWSFGSNRIQVQAEIKLLGEVLHALQNDHIRGDHDITSLPERSPNFPVPGKLSVIRNRASLAANNPPAQKVILRCETTLSSMQRDHDSYSF